MFTNQPPAKHRAQAREARSPAATCKTPGKPGLFTIFRRAYPRLLPQRVGAWNVDKQLLFYGPYAGDLELL
ncbi:hypothetical protein GCM10022417_19700 [Corynebacterium pilbarense]